MNTFSLAANILNVKYGIIAVHAMVKALRNVYNILCQSGQSNCTMAEFQRAFSRQRDMLLDEMNKLEVNFGSDFDVKAEPLTTITPSSLTTRHSLCIAPTMKFTRCIRLEMLRPTT